MSQTLVGLFRAGGRITLLNLYYRAEYGLDISLLLTHMDHDYKEYNTT